MRQKVVKCNGVKINSVLFYSYMLYYATMNNLFPDTSCYDHTNMSADDQHDFFTSLGQRLRETRKAQGFTQTEVAKRLEVSQQVYASYEVGRLRLPASLLPDLAGILSVPVETLLGMDAPRGKRGPVPRLLQQVEQVAKLPRQRQQFVIDFLDTVLKQAS
jgi:transcriptional regulator with XRE-family HTH domain